MLSKTKKRKYEKLREADFKALKEEKLEQPSKKSSSSVPQGILKVKQIEEEKKIEELPASDSEKYDTEFEDEFDDEYGKIYD